MKFTLSWLKQHLDTDATLDEITTRLTAIGLEIENVTDPARGLEGFVVAEIRECTRHPDADRLQVAVVDHGHGETQVVCGAPNCRLGLKGVFAPAGVVIPVTGEKLTKGTIRGIESRGMLCSERELKLSEEHDGIIELPADAEVGMPAARALGLDDPIIEINLTPNRADCAGVRGIARDLAAAGVGRLRPEDTAPVAGAFPSPVGVKIEAGDLCPLFVGRYIRGVKNGPSPEWLQARLKAVGLRPISALVDITNLLCLDRARPLHVYDAKKLSGDIIVRRGQPGESLAALDDQTYELDEAMCVVADSAAALGLGGVIGGSATGCGEDTVDVFLESALFAPGNIAATGRKLGIHSDARYRFERGVDPEGTIAGAELATRLILELCGGEPSELVIAGAAPQWRREILLDPAYVKRLGGVDLPAARQTEILARLGYEIEDGEAITVRPPSWRADVEGAPDLVEDVLRIEGYDRIASVAPDWRPTLTEVAVNEHRRRATMIRHALAERGLDEAVTYGFVSAEAATLFGGGAAELHITRPISADLAVMRPSVLPSLLAAAARNQARGLGDAHIFEIGAAFADAGEHGQLHVAACIRTRVMGDRHWAASQRAVDLYDAKADALAALAAIGAPVENLKATADAPGWFHPGRSGCLRLGATVLAVFGELHPAVLDKLDVRGPVAAFELYYDRVPEPKRRSRQKPRLDMAALQPVARDFAFILPAEVPAETLLAAARGADKALIAGVSLFDHYAGKGVPEGQKSLAICVTLQPRDHTLTDAEIEAVADKVVAAVTAKTGATLRG